MTFGLDDIPVFLVNLATSTERMAAAKERLDQAGIPFERFDAFDGRGRTAGSFDAYSAKGSMRFFNRELSGGEIGCFLSHQNAAKALLETDAPAGLVLEDDVVPQDHARATTEFAMNELLASGREWNIANLGRHPHRLYRRRSTNSNDVWLIDSYYFPLTTTAILWSRAGAERFLKDSETIYAPVDHYLRSWVSRRGGGASVMPSPFLPSGAESELDKVAEELVLARKNTKNFGYRWAEIRRQAGHYSRAIKQKSLGYFSE